MGLEAGDKRQVDHKNRNGLDNRRSNLRIASHAQNMQNRGLDKHNRSGYRGVSWEKRWQRWRAVIQVDGRQQHIGHFKNIEEAASAVAEARAKTMPFA
jgi:hypothetical protein